MNTEVYPKTLLQRALSYVGLGPEDEYQTTQTKEQVESPAIQRHDLNPQVFQTPPISQGLQVVEPESFSDSQKIADLFKANCPVIMNLERTHTKYTRRLVDFASGLVYGLGGRIKNVSSHIFLLEPAGAYTTEQNIQSYLAEAKTTGYN